ncbi:MAG: hypothetical protein JWN44_6925 [Myxococcales bacterium]|nr:hypothetical protein [Myxococcales bacterium]
MFAVDNRVGRLVEVRVSSLATLAQLEALNARFREIASRIDSGRLMICADFSAVTNLASDVADRLGQLFHAHNPRVARGGVLCAPEEVEVCARLERSVVLGGNRERRNFTEAADLIAWLGEVLTDDERGRLIDFLAPRRP